MVSGASASPTTTAYPSVLRGVPESVTAWPVVSWRLIAKYVMPPMTASTATTAATTRSERRRSARCCCCSAARARSAVDVGLFVDMVELLGGLVRVQGSEDEGVEGQPRARAPDQPQRQEQQTRVAGDVPGVLGGGVGVEP